MKTFGWVCIGLGIAVWVGIIYALASGNGGLVLKGIFASFVSLGYGIRTVRQEGKKDATSNKSNKA